MPIPSDLNDLLIKVGPTVLVYFIASCFCLYAAISAAETAWKRLVRRSKAPQPPPKPWKAQVRGHDGRLHTVELPASRVDELMKDFRGETSS